MMALAASSASISIDNVISGDNGRHQRDQSGIDHQLRHLGNSPDTLNAVGVSETKVAI